MSISKYSALYRFLNNSRTQSARDLRFSPEGSGDIGTPFSPILYETKIFLNPSFLQNIAKNAWKRPGILITLSKIKSSIYSQENYEFLLIFKQIFLLFVKILSQRKRISVYSFDVLQKRLILKWLRLVQCCRKRRPRISSIDWWKLQHIVFWNR